MISGVPRLVLVRHGQSEGNAKNIFTGWLDLPLTRRGREEADRTSLQLERMAFFPQRVFSSRLSRAVETAKIISSRIAPEVPLVTDAAVNERNYGDLSGLDKQQAVAKYGAERIRRWRRSASEAPPGGESLIETIARTRPFLNDRVIPALDEGHDVLIVGHGNSLRSLISAIEGLSNAEIEQLEIATGEIRAYLANGGTLSRCQKVA